MRGRGKAVSSPKMSWSDATEEGKNMVEVPVLGGNVRDGEGKERRDFDYNGDNLDDKEGEEDDDKTEEEAEEEEGEEEFEFEGEDERPKLDEGFFEIEAIRRKRVRKGQLQYLIKWRGWPETSNTWEPLENLQFCSDVIDAFEESLRSGKSSRKRKRKHWGPHIMPKKKQQLSSTGYKITGVEISVDKTSSSLLNNSSLADGHTDSGHDRENNGNGSTIRTAKKTDENWHTNGSKQNFDKKVHTNGPKQNFNKKEDNEYDPKLSELKGTLSTNDVNADKLGVHFREGNSSGGDGPVNGIPKLDYVDLVENKPCTGAKRRKSGSVKRFKKDLAVYEQTCSQSSPLNVTVGLGGQIAPGGVENDTLFGANSSYKPVAVDSLVITEIIKPIGFSSSVMDNNQNVLVSFLALRSDGKEVVVDNKFLKFNNPHLLIDFYEQHLKYSA